MIFILARDVDDARQWCAFNGVRLQESIYVGTSMRMQGRRLTASDRIVRTALHKMHPDNRHIERVLAQNLVLQALTETVHGNLVPQGT